MLWTDNEVARVCRRCSLPHGRTAGRRALTRSQAMTVRILIADDDAAIRRLLRRLIETHAGWQICGEACDGGDTVDKATELNPDVIVIDLAMPQMNGLQAARAISKNQPETPMLLLTVQQVSKELNTEAAHAGFKGAVSKNTGSEVVRAIEILLGHQNFFQPAQSDAYV
jgi:DNA-binding NarL/FixJ family response regulator